MQQDPDCIFCKIARNEIPSYKIYEEDNFLAFLDINPTSEGHTVVIQKNHYGYVWDVENIGDYMKVCKKIAEHFRKVIKNKIVYSIIHGEGVEHAHIHLIPKVDEKWAKQFNDAFPTQKLEAVKAKELLNKYSMLK